MHWIQTYTGKRFGFSGFRKEDLSVRDIAHSLSLLCRFTGHCREFYSVAQHSVLMSYRVEPELAIAALMHDASEAYVGDMSLPLKSMPGLDRYREIEDQILLEIFLHFGIDGALIKHVEIKIADKRMLATEKRDLLTVKRDDFFVDVEPYEEKIDPWPSEKAEFRFLDRFLDLVGDRFILV